MSANHFSSFILDVFMVSTPTEKPIHYIVTGFLLLLAFYTVTGHDQSLPEVNPRRALEVTNRRRMNDFIHNGKQLMIQAKATFGKNPYRILSEWGSLVVLPADYLPELRNDPRLDFMTPSNDPISDEATIVLRQVMTDATGNPNPSPLTRFCNISDDNY
ncbi:hypothetical protein COL940_008545 [Colletotrichum noveboracense]|nr:hypothetical protein COL940_008545 [Colletotrichum noveboracense]